MDDLETYKAQLEQVEAALTSDPENEELLKLKKDLDEVINLTLELAQPADTGSSFTSAFEDGPSSSSSSRPAAVAHTFTKRAASNPANQSVFANNKPRHARPWKPGDRCMAPWNDGRFHPAKVDEIVDESVCSVVFEGYGQTEVAMLTKLLPYVNTEADGPDAKKAMTKKDLLEREKERKKKKKARWQEKVKEIEEDREKEKNKWQSFSHKAIAKSKKGTVKKSIFATPEDGRGRVGFGTCGQSGQEMTKITKINAFKPSLEPQRRK